MSVLQMRAVSRNFGEVAAVHEVDLDIDEGQLVVLLGRSGSGKTTLLSLAGGLDRPDSGSIAVAGNDLGGLDAAALAEFRRKVTGWVFQAAGLLPLLSAEENVALALRIQGRSAAEAGVSARAALKVVGLEDRERHRGYELSGGEQQRVALARALVKNPRLLLADEPTGQLDSETAHSVMALLRLLSEEGMTILLATHDEAFAQIADRVLTIDDGRVSQTQGHA
ncbi:MAG TPA: ABC transporter ATP-binding protein [Candidatus Micrarchaeaceae archaeon]|nr:ABC transporter ATP-binding protein [Candidatus Micrarchaeaceae archaeon]